MPLDNQYYAGAKALESELAIFMQDIIRIPSLSSEEGAVIEFLYIGNDARHLVNRVDPAFRCRPMAGKT
jgi:hypothetical protein